MKWVILGQMILDEDTDKHYLVSDVAGGRRLLKPMELYVTPIGTLQDQLLGLLQERLGYDG